MVTTLRFLRRHQGQGPPSLCPWQELCGLLDLFNYYANGEDPERFSKELQLDTKVIFPLLYRLGSCGSASSNSPLVQAHCCFQFFIVQFLHARK